MGSRIEMGDRRRADDPTAEAARRDLVRGIRRALLYLDKPHPTQRERLDTRHRLRGILRHVGESPDREDG